MISKKVKMHHLQDRDKALAPAYARRELSRTVPKYELPNEEMSPRTAYNIIHDELMLDGNARLNLATFVTTWMESEAPAAHGRDVRQEHDRQGRVPADGGASRCAASTCSRRLWNSPEADDSHRHARPPARARRACSAASRSSGNGSSARKAEGKPTDKPNMVMGINVQVCWDKFASYWDVELRHVPMEGDRYHPQRRGGGQALRREHHRRRRRDGHRPSTGSYEPVKEINDALDELQRATGWDVPIHVDGASGGFIAPFLQPDLEWDFRLHAGQVDQHLGAQVRPGVSGRRLGDLARRGGAAGGLDLLRSTTSAARCRPSP